jgi:hypothetical protein
MWRNGQREFVAREQNTAALLIAKIEVLSQVSERRNPVSELPFPIIPEFRGRLRPKTRRV